MRHRNAVSLALLLGAIGAVLMAPATAWLARLEMRTAVGMTHPALENARSPEQVRAVVAADPADFDLAYAAAIRQTGPLLTADALSVTEGTSTRVPAQLEALKATFPDRPELYADQIRYWSLGPLGLRHRDPEMPNAPTPPGDRAAIWSRAVEDAERGGRLAPDNAFFPAMRAVAQLARGDDDAGFRALHDAALCSRYDDYVWQEAHALWKLNDRVYGGETGSLPKMAQWASILLPHYAQMRALARIAAAEATRREQAGDRVGALTIRHDIAALGMLTRDQGSFVITNLVGIALVAIAPDGSPGWGKLDNAGKDEDARTRQAEARIQRYVAYLNGIGESDEARFYEAQFRASAEAKQVIHRVLNDPTTGTDGQLRSVVTAGAAQAAGVLLLANLGWLLLFGAGAALLCRTRGIRTGAGLPFVVHLSLWAAGFGAPFATACVQAQGIRGAQSLFSAFSGGIEGGAGGTPGISGFAPGVLPRPAVAHPARARHPG
jgi:hypothetical protein